MNKQIDLCSPTHIVVLISTVFLFKATLHCNIDTWYVEGRLTSCSRVAAATTLITSMGLMNTSSLYREPNAIFNAANKMGLMNTSSLYREPNAIFNAANSWDYFRDTIFTNFIIFKMQFKALNQGQSSYLVKQRATTHILVLYFHLQYLWWLFPSLTPSMNRWTYWQSKGTEKQEFNNFIIQHTTTKN